MDSKTAPWSALPPTEVLAGVKPRYQEALVAAWELGNSDPRRAAEQAEVVFSGLPEAPGLAHWLALITAVSGRIHSLSDFAGLSPFITFYKTHCSELHADDALAQRVDVAYLGALVFRDIADPDIERAARVAYDIAQGGADPLVQLEAANYLLLYRIWTGDLLGADVLRHQIMPLREQCADARTCLLSYSMSSMSLRLFLDYDACHREIEAGLQLAAQHGLHFWDSHFYMQGGFLALSRENLGEAQRWLDKMLGVSDPDAYLDRSGYHYLCAWRHMIQGEIAMALNHAQESTRLAERSGARFATAVTHMGLAQVYLEQRQRGRALRHMARARRMIRHMPDNAAMTFARGLAQASLCLKFEMHRRCERVLARTFAIGRRERYLNFPWWRSEHMARLCAYALERHIERDYVLLLIKTRRLRPPPGVRHWYWPLVIEVLGGPRIYLDGEPLSVGAKSEGLLVALAAWGNRDGYVDRTRLLDHLWPESEGDRAERALDTAVHRLRRQLGSEAVLCTRPGAVGLNPEFCRVDYWVLLERLKRRAAEDVQPMIDAIQAMAHLPSPVADLLPANSLRRRLLQTVLSLLDDELMGQIHEPLEVLVECVPEHEKVWQALIRSYVRQQLPSAAMDAWRRARVALIRHHGVGPGPATRALIAPWLESHRSDDSDG